MTPFRLELATLARLSLPVALTQLGVMMTGVVDTLMVSRLGVAELAATALANTWQWSFLSLGIGILMGLDPLISQAHGSGDGPGAALALQRGVVIAVLISIPICVALLLTESGLRMLGQDAEIAALAGDYNRWKLPTVPCFLVYSALRQYLQGRTLMAAATWVMWIGNLVHVPINWALIFGHGGAPAMGIRGAALGSSISTTFLLVALIVWVQKFRLHQGAWRRWDAQSFEAGALFRTLRLGLPVGVQVSLEVCAFSTSTLMAGWLGKSEVGSHQIVLNMASLAFMIPLGISQGVATRVGNLIGAGDELGLRRAVRAGLMLACLVMLVSGSAFALLRHWLPRLFTDDATVVLLASQILPIAAAFQLFDGLQVVAGGSLRGMGRSDGAALINLVGYYAFALPLAYFLAFRLQVGLTGIWLALALGLVAVALAVVMWLLSMARRPLAELRVRVERHG